MTDGLEQLVERARRASPNKRIDLRDDIAAHGADAVAVMGEWLDHPDFGRFAVRVIGSAADMGARESAIATLQMAREPATPAMRADIDTELTRLGVEPGKRWRRRTTDRKQRTWNPASLKEILYARAQEADPERKGVEVEDLWQRIVGTEAAAGRDAIAVRSAINGGQDLFERVHHQRNTFRWRADVQHVYEASEGALTGRRLAIVCHQHAKRLDPQAVGIHYYRLIDAVLEDGQRITGSNPGGTLHSAVSGATDLFERTKRGEFRWRRAASLEVPGWMMRTDRDRADWIWSEVKAGRLRQGWGSDPQRDLRVLRDRHAQGEPFDADDELAWNNRHMLTDEPDGMHLGDLILAPHLPRERRWSVLRVAGPYRYQIHDQMHDYGHVLPVEIVEADIDPQDVHVQEVLREAARYPARLMRMSDEQTADLHRLIAE